MIQPIKYKERVAINSLTGIKSSLAHLRSVVSLTYLLYLANEKKPFVSYSVSNSNQGISLRPDYLSFIKNYLDDNTIETDISSNPLLTSQIESLYVGITLMFGLGRISFENQTFGMTKERTGGKRYPKKIEFASNIILLDSIIQCIDDNEKKRFLKSWLKNEKADSSLELRIATFLNVCIENNLFKLRDGEKDVFFQTEGMYLALQKDEEVSLESDEKVGPARILNSMLREGLIPWLSIKNSSVKLNAECDFDIDSYSKILSTSLDIRDIKVDAVEDIELVEEDENDFMSISLQQIFYGAPGTGKSHKIKDDERVKSSDEKNLVFRTTFHPDSDYSTFVGAYKPTMKPVADKYKAVAGKDEEITYEFIPQAFLQAYIAAWNNQEENVFLLIEEINRGNCAQIFGDLFQLLDRDDNGFSEYPIKADRDLAKYLRGKDEIGNDVLVNKDGIKEGKLKLPKNLYIWATMNTSDQSLFPIDSAFKRRWDWLYMPIGYKNKNWTIEIGDKKYNWVDFQRNINESIYAIDNSEDKQLGDYFVNADRTGFKVSADTLLNKILFYIWNDVCKDDPDQIFRWIDDKQEKSIKFSDFFDADRDKKLQGFMSFHKVSAIGDPTNTDNSEDIQDSEGTEMDDIPTEDDNEVNS